MQQMTNIERAADARAVPRTNMFLAAVLQGAGYSAPVKIRNMSPGGALVEAASVPLAGTTVRLLRGSLVVPANVAWSTQRRCGLRFSSVVSIRDWLAPPGNAEQQRVDDLVRVVKAGALPFAAHQRPNTAGTNPDAAGPSAQLTEDLLHAIELVEGLGEDVAADETALARHGQRLMDLDIAVQTIKAVADMLKGGDQSTALSRLENLRTSYAQALRR